LVVIEVSDIEEVYLLEDRIPKIMQEQEKALSEQSGNNKGKK
jgi:hypothetical protein